MLIAVLTNKFIVTNYNFQRTFVPHPGVYSVAAAAAVAMTSLLL